MKTLILLAIVVTTFSFAQTAAKTGTTAKTGAAHKAAAKTGVAKKTGAPASSSARLLNPALWTRQAPEEYKAKLATTKGDIVIDVHRDWAPRGADRFYNLVRSGYLNNASFYRVAPGFIVQFGAAADPKVGAAWEKAPIKDDPVKHSNKPYTITFAATGMPNSRTTELFINLRDNAGLDPQGFSAFGEVVEGKELVDQIYSGYGEMAEQGGKGPSQQMLKMHGKAYLDKSFPKLDSIKAATIISAEPAAAPKPAPKPAAPAAKKASPKTVAK
jgi:peptidyl-prolyl cis-trans isomerase A (cyclophilin A)